MIGLLLSSGMAALANTWSEPIAFTALLVPLVAVAYLGATRAPGILLVAVWATAAYILAQGSLGVGEGIKLLCELPLGLGSLLMFALLSPSAQDRLLPAFTCYVNAAVFGNIAMMVFTPSGGTYRGLAARAACLALVAWLAQQARRVGWATVEMRSRRFCYNAVSMHWVLAHAAYRAILYSLPGIAARNRLLELVSLGTMVLLSRGLPGLPISHSFGLADTIVIPSSLSLSCLLQLHNGSLADPLLGNTAADIALAAVLLVIAALAAWHAWRGWDAAKLTRGPSESACTETVAEGPEKVTAALLVAQS